MGLQCIFDTVLPDCPGKRNSSNSKKKKKKTRLFNIFTAAMLKKNKNVLTAFLHCPVEEKCLYQDIGRALNNNVPQHQS